METLNRTFKSATNALWNEIQATTQPPQESQPHGEEPMSGIQGTGSVTDPYDGGNRDDQPGAPRTTANTALIPEPLVSTAAATTTAAGDHAQNPQSPSNADLALKNVIVDEPALPTQKMEYPDPMTAAAPTKAAETAGAPSSGSAGMKQLAASGGALQGGKTTGVSEQRGGVLPLTSNSPSAWLGEGSGSGAGETLAIREKKKDDLLQANRGLPASEGMQPAPATATASAHEPNDDDDRLRSSAAAAGIVGAGAGTTTAGAGAGAGAGALRTKPQPDTIPSSSIAPEDKIASKDQPFGARSTSASQPQQQQQTEKPTTTTTTTGAGTASDTESVGPSNEKKDSITSPAEHDTLPTATHDNKVSEEALKGPQTPAPREPFEFEKRMGSKGGAAKSMEGYVFAPQAGAGADGSNDTEAEKHGKGHGQGKMAHLKEKVGKVLHHGSYDIMDTAFAFVEI
ncbi:uncharacterized protein BP01DRAFT_367099 [Aspergillus saccharolyticus JOP 1030-1]|uniref:Uncharacterized protein n=1 Tax=Aspergillus saccharolyticus JOP 1030-1 TaxID=1450539 RepID=A0A318ZBH0_9EURO|nr:hypothetical protein BP01DRAFT_367099 [Aspergillus saccharolyticus JOP 1030-1]PYH43847.1 hypothetical protein BP01DRAFT_367099 [Aspergillus saccharolyticus JOP 1030-1]